MAKQDAETIAQETGQPIDEVRAFLALGYEWTDDKPSGYAVAYTERGRTIKPRWLHRGNGRVIQPVIELKPRDVWTLKATAYRPRGYKLTEKFPVWAWTTEPNDHHTAGRWFAYRSFQYPDTNRQGKYFDGRWNQRAHVDQDSILAFATRREAKAHAMAELEKLAK